MYVLILIVIQLAMLVPMLLITLRAINYLEGRITDLEMQDKILKQEIRMLEDRLRMNNKVGKLYGSIKSSPIN